MKLITLPESLKQNISESKLSSMFELRDSELNELAIVNKALLGREGMLKHFKYKGAALNVNDFNFNDFDLAKRKLDTLYWKKIIELSEVKDSMPSKKKEEWNSSILNNDVPDFTRENVIPTIQNILENQRFYFAERVDAVFHNLSDEHITNSPQGFGKRMIIKDIIDTKGGVFSSADRKDCATLDDLRVVSSILLGNSRVNVSEGNTKDIIDLMYQTKQIGKWVPIDGNTISLKVFKVGTVHVEIHPELVAKLNDILASIYPLAIPERFRRVVKNKSQDSFINPIEDKCISIETGNELINYKRCYLHERHYKYLKDLYPEYDFLYEFKDSEQVSQVLEMIGGKNLNNGLWAFDDSRVLMALPTIVMNGSLPNIKDFQFYPTKSEVGHVAAELLRLNMQNEVGMLLEPSIGQGDLANTIPEANWIGVELSPFVPSNLSEGVLLGQLDGSFSYYESINYHSQFSDTKISVKIVVIIKKEMM